MTNIHRLIVFFCFVSYSLNAQNYTTKKNVTGKAKTYYEEGMKHNYANENEKALKAFTSALKEDTHFIDAQIQQGAMFLELNKLPEAQIAFEKVLQIDPNYSPLVYYSLGNIALKQEKYIKAAENYENYAKNAKSNETLKEKAERFAENARFTENALMHPVPFKPILLNEKINDPLYSQYRAALTAEENMLVFTRLINKQEDIYFSIRDTGIDAMHRISTDWQTAQPLAEINTGDGNEGSHCISADGRLLLFTDCGREINGKKSCDIYYSVKTPEKNWSSPRPFGGNAINTEAWESQPSLSADNRLLFFASNRAGGYGGIDIWYSRFGAGKWSTPRNAGPMINTKYDDEMPFLHADGTSFYFMSDGHPGMGGKDLYLSRISFEQIALSNEPPIDSSSKLKAQNSKPDTLIFSKPINLGYPINTKDNEGTLTVSIDGKTAYYSRNSFEQLALSNESATDQSSKLKAQSPKHINLYSFELPVAVQAQPVTYIKAQVRDAVTQQNLVARIEVLDLLTQKIIAQSRTTDSGVFLICLPIGKNYAMNVTREGYAFSSDNFNLTEQHGILQPFVKTIFLTPIKPQGNQSQTNRPTDQPTNRLNPIILKNIFFETAQAELKRESQPELNKLRLLLKENPTMRIEIRGHTDNVGNENENQILSQRRAKAVYDFLIQKGIEATRLTYKGFGKMLPIDTNDTEQGRANNRRTEFVIL